MRPGLFLIFIALYGSLSSAQFLPYTEGRYGVNTAPPREIGKFVTPNEWHPEEMRELMRGAPDGAYISVGTERGFIGAALTPNATHLVLADYDPKVVAYNKINIALLTLAKDRKHYVSLRKTESYQEWKKAGVKLTEDDFKFWRSYQTTLNPDVSYRFKYDFEAMELDEYFIGSNYLKDDKLFAKLKRMAREKKMDAVLLDLTNEDGVRALVQDLKTQNISLSVLDISNAWVHLYSLNESIDKMMDVFSALAKPTSRLLTSHGFSVPHWLYAGFTFRFYRKLKSKEMDFKIVLNSMFDKIYQALLPHDIAYNNSEDRQLAAKIYQQARNQIQAPLLDAAAITADGLQLPDTGSLAGCTPALKD